MTVVRWGLALVATGLVAGSGWLAHATRPSPLPSFESVRADYRSSEAALLDRRGDVLQTLRMDYSARRLDWTPLENISPALKNAVLAAEDRRFESHAGVDAAAVLGALRDRVQHDARRGASTLEMQLVAQLDERLRSRGKRRGVMQKLRQMRAALALGNVWTKPQVLEAYLNLVSFRGETQGVAAAARGLFDKRPEDLAEAESWVLVALLPSPGAPVQTVSRRACAIAHAAEKECQALRQVAGNAFGSRRSKSPLVHPDAATHLARRLLRRPGERVVSTLDARVQALVAHALEAQLRRLEAEEVRDAAAVVVDNASGEVLAYVGSAGLASRATQVDGARALRQAGSTLKPFLYAMAIERGWITAASLLDDAPVALEAGPGLYLPQNYEHDYKGLVSVRTALAGSLNIPAVRSLLITGIEPFRERLRALGYVEGLTESGEYYGYSLALGSAEVSLLEQVNAYRTLANAGRWSALQLRLDTPQNTAPRAVISPAAAWIVSDVLSDRAARALTFDFGGPLSTPYWSAVKTGTSKNLRDNWCIGFTRRHTVGVWVGNFEGDPMRTVSGITGAAPAWREIMDALASGTPDSAPPAPGGLVRALVHFDSGREADREEWFIAGTQSAQVRAAAPTPSRPRLASPAAGSLIALDPDIPLERQHVLLRAEPASAGLRLRLNDRELGSAAEPQLWTPLPGAHHLALLDANGRTLDQIEFTVRGPR